MDPSTLEAMARKPYADFIRQISRDADRECERAKSDLVDALNEGARGIERALTLLADGMGVPTTASGEGMILSHNAERINVLAEKWMAAERRRAQVQS